jgi:hypothetical protein
MMAARAARTDKTGAEATVGWLAGLSSGEELALQAQPLPRLHPPVALFRVCLIFRVKV